MHWESQEKTREVKLFVIPEFNREELYCEEGVRYTLNFTVINTGKNPSGPIHIKARYPKIFSDFQPGYNESWAV